MDGDSLLVRLGSLTLFSGNGLAGTAGRTERDVELAAALPVEGEFYGVSLDPSSHFRQLLIFLDDHPEPFPLVGGEILKASFRRARVAPFHRVTWETGSVTSGLFTLSPRLNNQVAALRLYRAPPQQSHLELPSVLQLTQDLLSSGFLAGGIGQPLLYHVHAPGARCLTFFGGSHGDAGTPATSVSLRAVHPERPRSDVLLTSLSTAVFTNVLATLAMGGGATSTAATVIQNPGFVDYYIDAGPTTSPGTYNLEVGLIIEYS